MWGVQATRKFRELGHAGKIINATSQTGVVGNPNLMLQFFQQKFAIRGITQVARELASEGILVNAYAPGIVKTPMMMDIAHRIAGMPGRTMSGKNILQGYCPCACRAVRSGSSRVVPRRPDSDYITGQTIEVDGGCSSTDSTGQV